MSDRRETEHRRALARRVADAHAARQPAGLMAVLSGSVADAAADALSDIDLGFTYDRLPDEAELRAACAAAGAQPWYWQAGALAEGSLVVAFRLDGIEVQIAYADTATLQRDLDEVLVQHQPDTPNHKLAEGLGKAEALAGAETLAALQARIAVFPPALGRAMAAHFLGRVTPWRAIGQLVERDATLWCRELQVALGLRLVGALAGLNGRYFTTFQFKRMAAFLAPLPDAPPDCAARLEAALHAPARAAFDQLHALEAEVTARVAARWPDLDLTAARQRHASYPPAPPVPAPALSRR